VNRDGNCSAASVTLSASQAAPRGINEENATKLQMLSYSLAYDATSIPWPNVSAFGNVRRSGNGHDYLLRKQGD
jgi:hypothetical protein